ncbi:MAG: hypothetical protein LC687_01555 [Actinobacteria bacterium]|nr:hypothetical protein [Actinomycetota bacterium]
MEIALLDLAPIIVAIVAALGAWAAQRSSSNAARVNSTVSIRLEAEREAYERARAFDVQTIERQGAEVHSLRESNEGMRREIIVLQRRVLKLENELADIEEETDDYH